MIKEAILRLPVWVQCVIGIYTVMLFFIFTIYIADFFELASFEYSKEKPKYWRTTFSMLFILFISPLYCVYLCFESTFKGVVSIWKRRGNKCKQ